MKNYKKILILGVIPIIVSILAKFLPPTFIITGLIYYPLSRARDIIGYDFINCEWFSCWPTLAGTAILFCYFLAAGFLTIFCLSVFSKKSITWLRTIIIFIIFLTPLYAYTAILYSVTFPESSSTFACSLLMDGPDNNPQSWCYRWLAEKRRDVNLCKIVKSEEVVASCYERLAFLKNDTSICSSLTIERQKNECLSKTMHYLNTSTVESCSLISTQQSKDSCLFSTYLAGSVEKKKDSRICEMIIDPGIKQGCLVYVAKYTSNASICKSLSKSIDDFRNAEECFSEIAIYNNAPDICANILNDIRKTYCINRINFLRSRPDVAAKESPAYFSKESD